MCICGHPEEDHLHEGKKCIVPNCDCKGYENDTQVSN